MSKHAILSASSSERWLNCPPSARLCAGHNDQPSSFALEGTDAHALCAYLVEKALGRETEDPTENLTFYNNEMLSCAEEYRNFVLERIEAAKEFCSDPVVFIEQHLDFSRWVPDGFGTGDCVIVADEILQVIDYKHGLGVLVSAEMNPQMMCYALGALNAFDGIYDIREVQMTIFQPRRDNVSTFSISKEDLLSWADEVLIPKAKLAYAGEGEFKAGDHCRFCKIKATCRKRAEHFLELARYDFAKPDTLNDAEIAEILGRIDSLVTWAQEVRDYALQQAQVGKHYEGWKLVAGRSVRKYTDEDAVAKAVTDAGFNPYETRLLGITAMTRLLGRDRFSELLGDLVVKPPGKPALVPESDKRQAYISAAEDFKNCTD